MQSYNSFYFVVNMHLIWFSSWVFTLALAGECAFAASAVVTQNSVTINTLPRINVFAHGSESENDWTHLDSSQQIALGQDWKADEIFEFSLPTHWKKVVFACESNYSVVKWEAPKRANLSGAVRTESIRGQRGYSEPPVYLHISYLILSNITDRFTGDYKCTTPQTSTSSSRHLKHQENQGKTNSFYLFVPNGGDGDRLPKANDDIGDQETTIYKSLPFSINLDDDSAVSYLSPTTQFRFRANKPTLFVNSIPNNDAEGTITVKSLRTGYVKTFNFIIIDDDLYQAAGLEQEECKVDEDLGEDCEYISFKCQSATVRPPKIHFTPLNEQGCSVNNRQRKENVIVMSCGIGCTKLMTAEPRGIVKCVGDGVDAKPTEIRFPFDAYCSGRPYLIERGSVSRLSSPDNSSVTIPCTANHRKAHITLAKQHRVAPGMIDWQDTPVGINGVMYDPKEGFLVEKNNTNIYGTYLCVSDRTLLDWRDHMIVHVDAEDDIGETENTISEEPVADQSDDEDYTDSPPETDEDLYLRQYDSRDVFNNIKASRIPNVEYELGKEYYFVCYGSENVYSWGALWSLETEEGEIIQLKKGDFHAYTDDYDSALYNNDNSSGSVYSAITLQLDNKTVKSVRCKAPLLNSRFEWRQVSWPVLIVDKDDRNCKVNEQTMRIIQLGSSAEIAEELMSDNSIRAKRRAYRHYIVPDGSVSLRVKSDAGQPLTWSYEGISPPNEVSVSNFRSISKFSQSDSYCFASELQFNNLTREHTGHYIVSYTNEPERKMSFYLFVSSNKPPFFLRPATGEYNKIPWNQDEGMRLIIPCLVNNPNLRTSLYKKSKYGQLTERTSSFTYDPRRGFTSKISVLSQDEAVGDYLCLSRSLATYSVDKMEINVYADQSKSQPKENIYPLGQSSNNYEDNAEAEGSSEESGEYVPNIEIPLNASVEVDASGLYTVDGNVLVFLSYICSVSKAHASHGILWAERHENGQLKFIDNMRDQWEKEDGDSIISGYWTTVNPLGKENFTIECYVPISGSFEWASHSFSRSDIPDLK